MLCNRLVAAVVYDDAGAGTRNQARQLDLEATVRNRCREEEMAFAELPGFAHIEQCQFVAILQPLLERGRLDHLPHGSILAQIENFRMPGAWETRAHRSHFRTSRKAPWGFCLQSVAAMLSRLRCLGGCALPAPPFSGTNRNAFMQVEILYCSA
jgi:hypothetical protein